MTSKEALKELILKYNIPHHILEPLRLLDKRDTPVKPIVFNYEEHRLNHIECQNGCKPFKDKEYKFCPYCGQRLDWSNNE